MVKEVNQLSIDGYWRNVNKIALPNFGGIYFVYECTFVEYNKSVNIRRLLYIGHSKNINKSLTNHELFQEWTSQLEEGNELCYGVTEVDGDMEAAIKTMKRNSKHVIFNSSNNQTRS